MSSLGDKIASVALTQVGYTEGKNNDNKYGSYFGANRQPWCAYFVMWCCQQAGYNASSKGFTGGCGSWLDRSNVSLSATFQPGDILVYVFQPGYKAQHVGVFISYNQDGTIKAVEGNTSSRSKSEGDGVYITTRRLQNVVGVVRLSGEVPGSSKGVVSSTTGGAYTEDKYRRDVEMSYEEIQTTRVVDGLKSAQNIAVDQVRGASLLTTPSLVESPFVMLRVGDYVFGSYTKQTLPSSVRVSFPNYITSLQALKVNGTVNQYVINLQYQITAGADPNLVDRIFSSIGYGKVYVSYGDWSSPAFIYKEEEAIITKLSSNIDFGSSRINYQLYCTSSSTSVLSDIRNFPERKARPSQLILDLLYSDVTTGLLDIFYGMKNKQQVFSRGLIPTNDKVVTIPAKRSIDVLSYINFLVTCMISNTNTQESPIQDSSYHLAVFDDRLNELNGPYFKITQVYSNASTISSIDTYTVDVGYPTDDLVMGFRIADDQSWALLYDYQSQLHPQDYMYSLDDSGMLITQYSESLTTSDHYHRTTESQKNWWTNMTQFPVKAELTLKGLLRPAMLMTYVRVNAQFYGKKHVSSGLYIITRQEDRLDSSGYRTVLQLTRIAGDTDYIQRETQTVISKVPKIITSTVMSSALSTTGVQKGQNTMVNTYTYRSGNTYTSNSFDLSTLTETQVRELINKGADIHRTPTTSRSSRATDSSNKKEAQIKASQSTRSSRR